MIKLFVGDKETLGFEGVVYELNLAEGRIFLYIKQKRFGQDEFNENLESFLLRQINLAGTIQDYTDIFQMESSIFYKHMKCFWDGFLSDECEGYKSNEFDYEKMDCDLIIRAGYAFDRHFIALVPSLNKEKLIVAYDDIHECTDIILTKGTFYGLLEELYQKVTITNNRSKHTP